MSQGFIGTGCSITWESGFLAEILDIGGPNFSREGVDFSHMGTTGVKPFKFDSMYDGGEMVVEIAFRPSDGAPPILDAADTVVINWSDSAASTTTFTAALTGWSSSTPVSGRSTATATLKIASDPVWA